MIRNVRIIAAVAAAIAVLACNRFEDSMHHDDEIRLKASVASNVIYTKAGVGELNSAYTDPLFMGFVRIDETQSGFPADYKGQEALTATMQGAADIKEINFNERYQTFADASLGVRYASWYPWYEHAAEEAVGPYKYDKSDAKVTFPLDDGNTDVLYGSVVTGSKSKDFNTIEYNHALVKYRIKAYALVPYDENKQPIASYMPDVLWGSVTGVNILDMPSTCVMELPKDGKETYSLTYPAAETTDYARTGDGGNPLLSTIPISMYEAETIAEVIAAPPVDGILKIEIATSKATAVQQITIARDFKPGHNYDIRLRFSSHGLINADVEVSEWGAGDDVNVETGGEVFFDLSSTISANCYMISSANYNYCFNVTIKGNGADGVLDGSDPTLNPGYLDVVWMDDSLEGKFVMSSNYPSQGRALFSLKGNPENFDDKSLPEGLEGNVLIGAYKDETKSELLWTWHLWICDRPQIQSYKNGFTVQDRDLGAVDYIPSSDAGKVDGLYYQWGRPTPFPVNRELADEFSIKSSSEIPGVNTAIVHPDIFYKDAVIAEDGKTYRLWGWRSAADEYVKTIYDPCPAGYRVPSKRLWAELDARNYTVSGHNVTFSVIDGYPVYYPISGYYNGPEATGGLKYYWDGISSFTEKVGAFMWSATYDTSAGVDNPYLMTYEYRAYNDHGMNTRPARDDGPALPVRCVAERSIPHVENLSSFQTANSYIVDEVGYYKFDVTKRGNGVGYLVSPGSTSSINLTEGLDVNIDVDHVDYLWWQGDMATGNKAGTPPVVLDNNGIPKDGHITFHIDEFRKGNLILAGYDVRGEILWTWHLWLTDTPQLKKSNEYVVLDRFLGATYAPEDRVQAVSMTTEQLNASHGFYYQWGRKDPFPASTANGAVSAKWWKYEGGVWTEKTALESAPVAGRSVMDAVKQPTLFHKVEKVYDSLPVFGSLDTDDFNGNDNIANRCFGLFINHSCSESLWGYSSASGFGKTSTKTIYDPCPPGYSVAYYLVWNGKYMGQDDGNCLLWNGNYVEEVEGKGAMLNPGRHSNLFDSTWYPFSGYIDPHRAEYVGIGSQGCFYSSTPGNNGARAFYYSTYGTGQLFVNTDYTGVATSFALPVRCQKD